MASQKTTLSATYTCSSSPPTAPTVLASAQVASSSSPASPPAANANLMHAYLPALAQLQADINTQLTSLLHLDAAMAAAGKSKQPAANTPDQDDDDEQDDDEEVEDQEDDIDDKHTLPASALGAPDSRASVASHKRPRLD